MHNKSNALESSPSPHSTPAQSMKKLSSTKPEPDVKKLGDRCSGGRPFSCHFLLQGIFPTRDQTHISCVSCVGKQILYHYLDVAKLFSTVAKAGLLKKSVYSCFCFQVNCPELANFRTKPRSLREEESIFCLLLHHRHPGTFDIQNRSNS